MAWNGKWIKWFFLFLTLIPFIGIGEETVIQSPQKIDTTWWKNQKKEIDYFTERPELKNSVSLKSSFNWHKIAFLKYLVLFLIIVILVYILYRLYGQSVFEFTGKKERKKLLQLNEEDLEERFLELNLNKLLKHAIAQKNWKMVIRIHFLQILKTLVDQEKINWHSDLTNRQISYQLPIMYRERFYHLMTIYEMAWYSNAEVNEAFYTRVKPKFDTFIAEVSHA